LGFSSHHGHGGLSYSNHGLDISGHSMQSMDGSNHSYSRNSLAYSNHGRRQRRAPRKYLSRHDSELSLSSVSSHGSVTSNGSESSSKYVHSYKKPFMPAKKDYLALDCEMCGTLTGKSACARVVLVDWKGRTVLDEYVNPDEKVTDYRTFVSGITEENLVDAPPLDEVRERVKTLIEGKILVGHGLSNDLECLELEHPWNLVRDTAYYEPFMKNHYGQMRPRKLKELSEEKLQREVQVDGQAHSPAEDAITALDLYKSHRPRWEACMASQQKEGARIMIAQQKMNQEDFQHYFSGLPVGSFH
jgi:RNA exonuclease 4